MGDIGEFFSNIYYRWKAKRVMKVHFASFYEKPQLLQECSKWSGIPSELLDEQYYAMVRSKMNNILSNVHKLAVADRKEQANVILERLFPESYDYKLVIVSKERKRINPPENISR